MPFTVLPIEVEALRKLEKTMRRLADQDSGPQAHERMAMADLLGSVLDRAEFDNAMTVRRQVVR